MRALARLGDAELVRLGDAEWSERVIVSCVHASIGVVTNSRHGKDTDMVYGTVRYTDGSTGHVVGHNALHVAAEAERLSRVGVHVVDIDIVIGKGK